MAWLRPVSLFRPGAAFARGLPPGRLVETGAGTARAVCWRVAGDGMTKKVKPARASGRRGEGLLAVRTSARLPGTQSAKGSQSPSVWMLWCAPR